MINNKPDNLELEEWIRLVHNGACCADNDPDQELKQCFIESIEESKKDSK